MVLQKKPIKFGTLLPSGKVLNRRSIKLSKKSPDPIAFAFGKFQGMSGKPFPKDKDLAPEFIRGFKLGRKKMKVKK